MAARNALLLFESRLSFRTTVYASDVLCQKIMAASRLCVRMCVCVCGCCCCCWGGGGGLFFFCVCHFVEVRPTVLI